MFNSPAFFHVRLKCFILQKCQRLEQAGVIVMSIIYMCKPQGEEYITGYSIFSVLLQCENHLDSYACNTVQYIDTYITIPFCDTRGPSRIIPRSTEYSTLTATP